MSDRGFCNECFGVNGWHYNGCACFPKKGNHECWECHWYNGVHAPSCVRRGYQMPPAPAAPPPAPPPPITPCPCGIARVDCTYHAPAATAELDDGGPWW